jgi:mitochondrial fission protein ELM1
MKILALKDFRIGSSKQTSFIAKKLSNDTVEKNIQYTKYIFIPNFIKPAGVGIDFKKSDNVLDEECPDVIIFAGRRLAGLALYLKKYFLRKNKKNVKLISILNPNYSFKHFDFVLLPLHDKVRKNKYNNIITFEGSLCDSNIKIDEKNFSFWKDNLKNYKTPFYSFMIGGDTKNKKMNNIELGKMLKKISDFVIDKNGTLLISTSRRTNESCIREIETKITCKNYLYKWKIDDNVPNPYYYFIENSEIVFITGDSISMISEIATMNKPLYVYLQENAVEKKHVKFCRSLMDKNIVKEINLQTTEITKFETTQMNELERVANIILAGIK